MVESGLGSVSNGYRSGCFDEALSKSWQIRDKVIEVMLLEDKKVWRKLRSSLIDRRVACACAGLVGLRWV